MKRSRRNKQDQIYENIELEKKPDTFDELQWADQEVYQEEILPDTAEEAQGYLDEFQDFYDEEYSDAHELADREGRFHIAIGIFDLISMIIGIVVIFVLVSMLVTLFNWLRNDVLQSALLWQSGLQ